MLFFVFKVEIRMSLLEEIVDPLHFKVKLLLGIDDATL